MRKKKASRNSFGETQIQQPQLAKLGWIYHVKSGHQRERQENAFEQFIQLSQELGLPLVIHSRDAEERVFELVHGVDQAIYHCYGGSVELLEKIMDCGHYISISTRVCRSGHHQKLVEKAPRDMVVIETDSPYLAARKGRNEPSFVGDAIVTISQVWDTEIEEAVAIVAENTCGLLIFNKEAYFGRIKEKHI